jgi:AcrR family transcriptional regulator
MVSGVRDRMVAGAVRLLAERGLQATSLSSVLAATNAPRGSIYHHFPGGKRQLAVDAIAWTSAQVLAHLDACPADNAAGVLAWFVDLWRQSVQASGGSSGCPVAGIAIDAGDGGDAGDADLMAAARAAFAQWTDRLADKLQAAGLPADRCGPVATTALAVMEGALILCRAERSIQPLEATARELMNLLPAQA